MARWDDLDLDREESATASAVVRSFKALLIEASRIRSVLIFAQLVVGVAIPIGAGWCTNLATSGDATKEATGKTAIVFLAIVQSLLLLGILFGPGTPASVVVEHERIIEDRGKFREHGRSLALVGRAFVGATVCAALASKRAIELLQRTGSDTINDLESELRYIIDPYMDAQHRALGFGQRAGVFRITIFELSDDLTELVPICSMREKGVVPRQRNIPREGSHAGQAIRANETKITPDAREVTEFLDVFDEDDRRWCVSMASFPIFVGDQVFGAGTVVCDLPKQFDEDGVEDVFDTLAGIISLYLSSREANATPSQDSEMGQQTEVGRYIADAPGDKH